MTDQVTLVTAALEKSETNAIPDIEGNKMDVLARNQYVQTATVRRLLAQAWLGLELEFPGTQKAAALAAAPSVHPAGQVEPTAVEPAAAESAEAAAETLADFSEESNEQPDGDALAAAAAAPHDAEDAQRDARWESQALEQEVHQAEVGQELTEAAAGCAQGALCAVKPEGDEGADETTLAEPDKFLARQLSRVINQVDLSQTGINVPFHLRPLAEMTDYMETFLSGTDDKEYNKKNWFGLACSQHPHS